MNLNKYIGIPYDETGRSWRGVSCWGLVWLIYWEEFGIDLPPYDGWFSHGKDYEGFYSVVQHETPRWQVVDEPVRGDVVLLGVATRKGRYPSHVGVVDEPGLMLHAEYGTDVSRERYDGPRWKNRIEAFYHYV